MEDEVEVVVVTSNRANASWSLCYCQVTAVGSSWSHGGLVDRLFSYHLLRQLQGQHQYVIIFCSGAGTGKVLVH